MSRRSVSLITTLKAQVPKKAKLLVAVSGGKDSVALLHGLIKLKRLLALELEVAHVDHRLRTDSFGDALLVENLASQSHLVFHKRILDKPADNVNIENWGRRERYSYFKSLLGERDLDFVVTAHHSGDVSETFLMRLVSNKELRSIYARNSKHKILRPLLALSRKEIDKYVLHHGLIFNEDPTNVDVRYLRNKVRNVLIPKLEDCFHPRVSEWIAERAQSLDADSRCLDKFAKIALKSLMGADLDSPAFRESLKGQPFAVGIRMVEFALLKRFGFRLGKSRAKLVRGVLLGRLPSCQLPCGYSIRWTKKQLCFDRLSDKLL